MKQRTITVGILLLFLVGLALPLHAGGFVWLSGIIHHPHEYDTKQVDNSLVRVSALLFASSRDRGYSNRDNDGIPLDDAIEDLDIALNDFVDDVGLDYEDLPLAEQEAVLDYMYCLEDALFDLDSLALEVSATPVTYDDTLVRLEVTIDDFDRRVAP